MNSELKKISYFEWMEINHIFKLATWLSAIIFFVMFTLSLVVNLKWSITALLFGCSLLSFIFFFKSRRSGQTERNEIQFLVVVYMIALPIIYILIDMEICEIPIYFVLGNIYTAVILKGFKRNIMLGIQTLEYSAAIWYVTVWHSMGAYDTAKLPANIYIRLLLSVTVVGTAGGILLMYRNKILLEEIQKGEERSGREKEINAERNIFIKNVSRVLNNFLHKIISTTDMLMQMNIEVQRKEDILFIENSAKKLSALSDKLGDRENNKTEESFRVRSFASTKFTCPNATVLAVDDNIINLEIVKSMLEQYQCRILGAMSGKECLSILENEKPDIIFLDYMMPEMDGLETLKRIRETEMGQNKKTPVIMLTANVESGAKEEFIKSGFNDYMEKPVDMLSIRNILERYLDKDKYGR